MKKILLYLLIYLLFSGCTFTDVMAIGTKNHKITILDQAVLEYKEKNHIPFSEISDLAYDAKKHTLYMIGDKGYLYRFSATFSKKIDTLKYIHASSLKNNKNKILHFDSEGLTFDDKHQLIISFEKKPKISKVSTKGVLFSSYKLPKKLRNIKSYRNSNSIFEALAHHPKYGILTVAEFPINQQPHTNQTIYSLKGKEWHFKAQNHRNSAVTAMEVMDDNNLLIVERAYNGLRHPFIITLKKIFINKCNKKNLCQSSVLATFNSAEGWGYNNFEGLAKVGDNRYIMISDNNQRTMLPTMLIYFKVNP